jgi:hypothetical protein
MLSWLAMPFHAVRLGLEAQNALAFGFLRLVGSATNTEPHKMIADKIGVTPDVQAPAAKLAPSGARSRALVNNAPKKRKRSPKRKGAR